MLRVLIPAHIDQMARPVAGDVYALTGACMGTTWNARVVSEHAPGSLHTEIAAVLERIEASMSHFRDESELSRFARIPSGDAFAASADFIQVMHAALEVARCSNGAFDPTVAPAIEAWGFGAHNRYSDAGFQIPLAAKFRSSAAWQKLRIDATNCLIQPGGVSLNLAAIAKGYAVDAVSEHLSSNGYPHHLIEVGGELRGTGIKPDGNPWWVEFDSPAKDCPLPVTRLALHGISVATSGDYRRAYKLGNRTLQHTIDPRTGAPVERGLSAVSVIHKSCMHADAWATALMVAGSRMGLALAEKYNLNVLMQWRDADGCWQEACSSAFRRMEH